MTPEDQTTALGVLRWRVNRLLALVLILLVITAWSLVRLNRLGASCQPHAHRVQVSDNGGILTGIFGGTGQPVCS